MTKKKYLITESQLSTIVKSLINEQGLYGNPNDTVDYELPEYLSDVIILKEPKNYNDVQKSIKELHKRIVMLEKGLPTVGSGQKPYSSDHDYSKVNRRLNSLELKSDSDFRDDRLEDEIENLKMKIIEK